MPTPALHKKANLPVKWVLKVRGGRHKPSSLLLSLCWRISRQDAVQVLYHTAMKLVS